MAHWMIGRPEVREETSWYDQREVTHSEVLCLRTCYKVAAWVAVVAIHGRVLQQQHSMAKPPRRHPGKLLAALSCRKRRPEEPPCRTSSALDKAHSAGRESPVFLDFLQCPCSTLC